MWSKTDKNDELKNVLSFNKAAEIPLTWHEIFCFVINKALYPVE